MARRRSTLTPIEHSFLEELLVHGNEIEVGVARERLNDDAVFFDEELDDLDHNDTDSGDRNPSEHVDDSEEVVNGVKNLHVQDYDDEDNEDDDGNDGFGANLTIDREEIPSFEELSPSSSSLLSHNTPKSEKPPIVPALPRLPPVKRAQTGNSIIGDNQNKRAQRKRSSLPPREAFATGRRGSERMKAHFLNRRDSGIYSQLWKAHESGLAMSDTASKVSLIKRTNSFVRPSKDVVLNNSFLSTATQELVLEGGPTRRPGEDIIFRSPGGSASTGMPRLPTPVQKRATADIIPLPSELTRLRSDSSRKSVSFKGSPSFSAQQQQQQQQRPRVPRVPRRISTSDRITSVESTLTTEPISPPPLRLAKRLDSTASNVSIPSIHRAAPVRSDSTAASEVSSARSSIRRPVLFRKASRNAYNGEGIEVTDPTTEMVPTSLSADSLIRARNYRSLMTSSFDDCSERNGIFRRRRSSSHRLDTINSKSSTTIHSSDANYLRRSLSDEDLSAYFLGSTSKSCLCLFES